MNDVLTILPEPLNSPAVGISTFVQNRSCGNTFDVRSPSEYRKGHVPGACSSPLFSDAERAEVGTAYRHHGRPAAMQAGFDLVRPKLAGLVGHIQKNIGDGGAPVQLYCARGGLRSRSVAWLLAQNGIDAVILDGGYKSFRRFVLESFAQPWQLCVVSGLTGSGKTRILHALQELGEQTIDLEKLANHRGSAFGGIGLGDQPSVEHFENLLFDQLHQLDQNQSIWIEDESRKIGRATIPDAFYHRLKQAPAVFVDLDLQTRVDHLLSEYGNLDRVAVIESIERISKRLGGQHAKRAIRQLNLGDLRGCIETVLPYYDKRYLFSKARIERAVFHSFCPPTHDPEQIAREMIKFKPLLG